MSKKRTSKEVVNFLKDANDLTKLITGHAIPDLVNRGMRLLGITDRMETIAKPPKTGPYAVLGVREDAADIIVQAAWRSLVKRSHPDVGGDPEEFKKFQAAYEEIGESRGWK